ncbi:hypothetical protein C8R43DRAFT_895446 [Mycena crocata]|nr:hypothetical protein C8R43DRAFT_895446 [Mycena crocata]
MEAAEERARQLHGRAARRHFHGKCFSGLNYVLSSIICWEARNLSRKIGEIDVHFLFVSEAIKQVEKSLQEAIERGSDRIRVIVGRGLHSHDGRSKLRPAIIAEMQRQGIHCQILAGNPGVLVLTVP